VHIASPFRYDWIGQKSFDGACPLGPWIVPATEVPDPQVLKIRTYVNDKIKQDSNTSKMLFTTAEQIAHLASRITLHPGDIILTGTPAGVGAETGERLAKGDRVRVQIEKIGQLTTYIV
jgi:2-keto-4-pentenoate hydratase/2-oxohepta-3-ene-1,7-dioic acid hydratase in catechol pathway